MSSETSYEVLSEDKETQLRFARNHIEKILNKVLENKLYDMPLDSWDCIIVIMGEKGFDERVMYSVKKRNMDFRLKIDHVAFIATDDLGRQKLIFTMLLRSLDLLKEKFKKARPKLDINAYEELERLRTDVLEVAKLQNWI